MSAARKWKLELGALSENHTQRFVAWPPMRRLYSQMLLGLRPPPQRVGAYRTPSCKLHVDMNAAAHKPSLRPIETGKQTVLIPDVVGRCVSVLHTEFIPFARSLLLT